MMSTSSSVVQRLIIVLEEEISKVNPDQQLMQCVKKDFALACKEEELY